MGNLRERYTNEEWDELLFKIQEDRKNGKPDDILLTLSIWNKDVDQLKKLRRVLSDFYSDHELRILDQWIFWKLNHDQR